MCGHPAAFQRTTHPVHPQPFGTAAGADTVAAMIAAAPTLARLAATAATAGRAASATATVAEAGGADPSWTAKARAAAARLAGFGAGAATLATGAGAAVGAAGIAASVAPTGARRERDEHGNTTGVKLLWHDLSVAVTVTFGRGLKNLVRLHGLHTTPGEQAAAADNVAQRSTNAINLAARATGQHRANPAAPPSRG